MGTSCVRHDARNSYVPSGGSTLTSAAVASYLRQPPPAARPVSSNTGADAALASAMSVPCSHTSPGRST